jgi:hypothetical protein
MLLLIDIFSINRGRGYENPSLDIIVIEHCSTGGCPLEEAYEHCFLNQSVISISISYIISVYFEDYVGYFIVILPFLAFYFCSIYFIYLVSCKLISLLNHKSVSHSNNQHKPHHNNHTKNALSIHYTISKSIHQDNNVTIPGFL